MALTSAQLISLACQDAKCPAYITQGGEFLNMILSDLCQTYDFEVARKTYYFNFQPGISALVGNSIYGSGPYMLPADYLRAAGPKAFFWTLQGVPYFMIPLDISEFDSAVQQAGLQAYPYWYATDLSIADETAEGQTAPGVYIYPPPSGTFPATFRYFAQMPDIATPETSAVVPWFPNQAYLRKRIAAELMGITNDDRQDSFLANADKLLEEYLRLKDDSSNRAKTVTLDRRRFGPSYGSAKNTKTIGW